MSDKQTEKTIQLDTPIKRGKTEITEIVLRKPQSGASARYTPAGHYGYGCKRDDDRDPPHLQSGTDCTGNCRDGPGRSHCHVG